MEPNFHLNPMHILRGLQALLAILTLGLLSHVAQFFNTTLEAPKVPNELAFAIFTSVLTLLVILPYVLLTPRYFPHLFKSHTKHTILTLESLTMILWFAAFVSVAAFLGKLSVCKGHVCNTAKVGAAVAAVAWVSWGVTSVFALRFCLGVGVGGSGIEKGERRRERVLRGLRVHAGWLGRKDEREKESWEGSERGTAAAASWPRDDWRTPERAANMI